MLAVGMEDHATPPSPARGPGQLAPWSPLPAVGHFSQEDGPETLVA